MSGRIGIMRVMVGIVLGVVGSLISACTSPAAGRVAASQQAVRSWRIALVSDPHVTRKAAEAPYREHFGRVIEEVNAAGVDAVLLAGDLANDGTSEELSDFRELSHSFRAPVYCVPGNHDVGGKAVAGKPASVTAERLARYQQIVGPPYYAATLAPGLRLVAITSSLIGSGMDAEEQQWEFLSRELRPRANEQTILLAHYPLFFRDAGEPADYFNIDPGPRQRLLERLHDAGVRLVLSGHLHYPMDLTYEDVRFLGAPAVSFGLPRNKQPEGWLLLRLSRDGSVSYDLRYLRSAAPATAPAAAQ